VIVLALLSSAVPAALADLNSGLVAYYPFNGNANDASGNGHDGVVFGGTLVEDRFGNPASAYSFEGGTNWIECAGNIGISDNQPRTVSVWFNAGLQIGYVGGFVGWPAQNLTGRTSDWACHLYFPETIDSEFRIDQGEPNLWCQTSNPSMFISWHHFVWTYQTNFGDAVFYIDGQVLPNKRYYDGPSDAMNTGIGALWIGAPPPEYNGVGFGYTELLDDVRIYNRALSSSEVLQLYNLEANYIPGILSQPMSQFVQVGASATFNVAASGPQPLSYQWQFNGQNVANATNSNLTLNSITAANSGGYFVVVSNTYGSVTSATAQLIPMIQTNRTPTEVEITSLVFLPSQLEVFQNGSFAAYVAPVDTNSMTIVLTHGWIPLNPLTANLLPLFSPNGVDDWPTTMATELNANGVAANIMAWNWKSAAESSVSDPSVAGSRTPNQGILLGQALLNVLGPNYSKPIHFIGHSFGTLVNSYAANYLQGMNFANEPVSSTPWPATNMQMTLFDEAEVGADKNFNLFGTA